MHILLSLVFVLLLAVIAIRLLKKLQTNRLFSGYFSRAGGHQPTGGNFRIIHQYHFDQNHKFIHFQYQACEYHLVISPNSHTLTPLQTNIEDQVYHVKSA